MENVELTLGQLDAIALSAGPGSYTGLRIGTATAKGFAFTLGIPMVAITSLASMFEQVAPMFSDDTVLIPMIDARRMEVFCLAKKADGQMVWEPKPLIVDENSFSEFNDQNLVFFGNGSDKFKEMFPEVKFVPEIHPSAAHMGKLAFDKFQKEQFEDSKKQVFKNRTPSKIEEERLIKVLLKREILPKNFFRERQRVKNESKSLSDMMQKLYYPIVSAWVEVARQSGDENWQYYSRISVNGVGDLILKHIDAEFVGLLTKEEYSEKDQEMRIKLKDAKKSMRSICSPWVDWLYQDGYLIDYDNR